MRSISSEKQHVGLSLADKRAAHLLLWALRPLSSLRGSIPLPYAIVFLLVALEKGKGVNAYARELGISLGNVALSP